MSAKIACIIGNRMLSPIEVCLKRGQKTKYMWICFSTKERYVYLHPYCQRQIALHSFWVTTDPICSIWHSSPKCSGTLVGWSWHEFYRDECLYHTDKDSGRWSGYRPQRHELENHLKNDSNQCIPNVSSSISIVQLGYPLKRFEWCTAITPSLSQKRVSPYNW